MSRRVAQMITELHTRPSRPLLLEKNVSQSRAKNSLSKMVNVNSRVVSRAISERSKILAGERKSLLYTKRKTRGNAIGEDVKRLHFTFGPMKSADSGDRKDVIQ